MRDGRFGRALRGGIVTGLILWVCSIAGTAAEDPFEAMRARPAVPPAALPDLVLSTPTGGSVRLAELRGKVVILGFFVTT